MNNKKFIFVLLCLTVFLVSFLLHWYPVYKKGMPPDLISESSILARNLVETGEYKTQNLIGTVLSSELINQDAVISVSYNKLTPVLYSYIYKIFGYNKDLSLIISLLIYSLISVLLFWLTKKLFNLNIALIQSVIFILLPVISYASVFSAFYEWGMLFFSIGLFFYLQSFNDRKYKNIYLVIGGIFLAVSSIARSAFIVSVIAILVYEFFRNRNFKRLLIFVLPLVIIWSSYLIPDMLNNRTNSFISDSQENFSVYGHLFPDPYTFYFQKEEFLSNFNEVDADATQLLMKMGEDVSFKDGLLMYWHSISFYPLKILKIIIIGGPLIVILLILGFKYLIKKNKDLAIFFSFWLIGWYILLILLKTNNWDHFIEIAYPVSLLVALGVYKISKLLKQQDKNFLSSNIWVILFLLFLFFHFILANKWMYHEEYNTSNYPKLKELSKIIDKYEISLEDVIAVDLHPDAPNYLNYFTNKNFIHFHPNTIESLYSQEKLYEVFKMYNIKYMIGFEAELIKKVQEQVSIIELIK